MEFSKYSWIPSLNMLKAVTNYLLGISQRIVNAEKYTGRSYNVIIILAFHVRLIWVGNKLHCTQHR